MKKGLSCFEAGYASEEATLAEIKRIYDDTGYVIDTHTAVASAVFRDLAAKGRCDDNTPVVIASTASPYKFSRSIVNAISGDAKNSSRTDLEMIDELDKILGTDGISGEPKAIQDIRTADILHDKHIKIDEMKQTVADFLK